uniref:Uncharacterized protein n=1 Tax=Nitrosopumivirus cobalaminus TaxID=3158414 RepID=A0AAU7N493_9VIRU
MTFEDDLSFGEKIEREFLEIMLDHLEVEGIKVAGYHSAYDIESSDGVKYEIKSDRKCALTGNVFVEISCNGEASGLFVTEADKIVYYLNNEWVFITPNSLHNLIADEEPRYWKGKPDGGSVVEGYIIPYETFIEYSEMIIQVEQ